MTGDPLIDAVVELVEGLIGQGVHALDPETRKKAVRDAVEAQRAQWASIITGSEAARADAIVAAHHVVPAHVAGIGPIDTAPDPLSRPALEAAIDALATKPGPT